MNFYKKPGRAAAERGFTLLELLVVLVILGLLAALVAPSVLKHLSKAKSDTAALQIKQFGQALDLYKLEVGNYPSSQDGLQALVEAPSDAGDKWNGPYLKEKTVPKDPWGNAYHYDSPGEHGAYDLYSYGADNREGGTGENKDVVSW